MAFSIPDNLVRMLRDQRAIPFVGAGFSSVHGLPNWDKLLEALAEEVQQGDEDVPALPYSEIREACADDPLQVAEFLYLRSGESIGPIRHHLSTALRTSASLVTSTPHIELVNLGAPHVYTTNFDDLIEQTYRQLGLQVDVVAVARDVARSNPNRTQIVKYHGDLRHEDTLVLTESQYYTRLEFESPMDLKLRSDLLGRSVLFMGYSFRDINIRVIWFRLMQMMKDVPTKDRPPSYIVRLRPNPVLDTLYEAVGLQTIVMDPEEHAGTTDEKNRLLSEFLLELSMKVGPGSRRKFVSPGLITAVEAEITALTMPARIRSVVRGRARTRALSSSPAVATTRLLELIGHLTDREVPAALRVDTEELVTRIARDVSVRSAPDLAARLATWWLRQFGAHPAITLVVGSSMMRTATRAATMSALTDDDWPLVWETRLSEPDVRILLRLFEDEVEGHEDDDPYEDHDVAFGVDVMTRIALGELYEGEDDDELVDEVQQLLGRAAEVYASIAEYVPPAARPAPDRIVDDIHKRLAELEQKRDEEADAGDPEDT